MDGVYQPQDEHELQRLQGYRKELLDRMARAIPEDGFFQPLQGFYLGRSASSMGTAHAVLKPSLCVIAQGSKEVLLGGSRYVYDPFHYLLATVELPCVSHILEASEKQPYLTCQLVLPPALVSSVMVETDFLALPDRTDVRAIDVSPLDVNLLDAVVRLVRLLGAPAEAPILMPLIMREIVYRLLMGAQGSRLRHLAISPSLTPDIATAIKRLHQDFDQPLRIEQLARELGMSVSGFHHHFKAVTAMSPLQFQKRLRLQEARRLMLSENLDAAGAAYRVGYNNAAHFNREYKSVFGIPPMRDIQRLRENASVYSG
ncbi:MAG: AraC family transcriptional regulator [bacterium]|nr:AraC family transcriptional regulator [bacterium]